MLVRSMDPWTQDFAYMSPFLLMVWILVTNLCRNHLLFLMNGQHLFCVLKYDDFFRLSSHCFFHLSCPKSKTTTELAHAHLMSNYGNDFLSRKKHRSCSGSNRPLSDVMASLQITTPPVLSIIIRVINNTHKL